MRSYIISISGEINSGKDTLASMINYIVAHGTSKANYGHWVINKLKYDDTFKDRIIHFADPLKDCLSIIYNIPREYFDDRDKKDKEWYSFTEKRFIKEHEANHFKYVKINMTDIKDLGLNRLFINFNDVKTRKNADQTLIIRLRTIMEYFGTEVVRNMMGDDVWINSTIGRAAQIAETRNVCIIPDTRFKNELHSIVYHSLYGGDITINRNSANKSDHTSNIIDFTTKYNIDNNGTKMQLFYKTIGIVQKILNKY